MDVAAEEGGVPLRNTHIKKRALRNKSLSVSFDEKDLKDFVGGFHKRKKKRRKEAMQQQEEAARRKRIELRKKRKLEREAVYGGGAPPDAIDAAESDEEHEDDEDSDSEPIPSVSGTMTYDDDEIQVIVTTSEISREEAVPADKSEVGRATLTEGSEKSKAKIPPVVRKKHLKKAPAKRTHPKPQSKRDKRKGKIKNSKR